MSVATKALVIAASEAQVRWLCFSQGVERFDDGLVRLWDEAQARGVSPLRVPILVLPGALHEEGPNGFWAADGAEVVADWKRRGGRVVEVTKGQVEDGEALPILDEIQLRRKEVAGP